jgi:hypothetical protein
MATIKISDLHPAGSELLLDSESYLNDLTDEEIKLTHGGSSGVCFQFSVALTRAAYLSYQLGRQHRGN